MESRKLNRVGVFWALLAVVAAGLLGSSLLRGQAAGQRFVGTVTAISGDRLTVKTDAGESHEVSVPSTAVIKQLSPGQKDLNSAQTIQLSDLATGDRVLIKLDPNATGTPAQALQVVAMKQTDIAQQQKKETEDWQRNGVGGLVKNVDVANGVVLLTSGAGPSTKTVTVHISKDTKLLRYAPNSVRYADARPAPLDAIQVGDQFHVRGQKNADGTEIVATQVVSGGFRNISGVVSAVDASGSTLTVKDLTTKKNVTVHITPDAEMRRLPDMMARMIAARLKGTAPAAGGAAAPAGPQGGAGAGAGSAGGYGQGSQGAGQGRRAGGDMEQALSRAPVLKLAELTKGEAVMLVSTQGTTDVTAIKLLAGVEPLLQSPEASRNLLSNWSMGSGGGEEAQ